MKLGFIYDAHFDMLSPLLKVIPDAQAAVCYLAAELSKLGHNVTLFSRSTNNLNVFDVRCRSINFEGGAVHSDPAIQESGYDALILVNNSAELAIQIKKILPRPVPIFLWTDLDHNATLNQCLNSTDVVAAIDGIICVSNWQRACFARFFNIPRDKLAVRFHAISPFMEELYFDGREFINNKPRDPQFAYIANPLTGLDILVDTFPDVTNNYPTATLTVFDPADFSSLDQQQITSLFQDASIIKGWKHFGAVSNLQLANHLRARSIFAYPNTTELTCSIPIMNAMAAGLYVVTSNLGGLPEYCTEHGKCITDKNLRSDSLDSFIGQVLAICQSQTNNPSSFYDYCFKQAVDLNKKHTWRVRAREWVHLLSNIS